MKLACASGALHCSLVAGDCTQLEFLDLCAHELACDGVVLDVRHFPRTDDDYLAHVKKMAVDRGLTIAALADTSFFAGESRRMGDVLGYAVSLGAPLIAAELARESDRPWSEQLANLNVATSLAKSCNVTLALRNASGTFAADSHDCKRVSKEADSAWLRFGPQPSTLGAAADPAELAPNSVLLWSDVGDATERGATQTLRWFPAFRGHLALDAADGNATIAEIAGALRTWRNALASPNRT